MPEELKQVPFPKITPGIETKSPPDLGDKSFSIDNFEVEQLPSHGEDSSKVEPKGGGESADLKKVDLKEEEKEPVKENVQKEEGVEDDKGTESKDKQGDKKLPPFFKQPQDKKAEEAPKAGEKKDASKPIVPISRVNRDYNGYSPEQVAAFKQMSDGAYKMTVDLIKQNKELSEKSNSSLMQHPQAYLLDPSYQEDRKTLQYRSAEINHWEQQLVNMDSGKDLIPLKGFDAKTGQPVYGEPLKASKLLEERVRGIIYDCNADARNLNTKLQEYPTKYQSNVKNDIAGIEDFRKQQFGWVGDESMMEQAIPIEGMGDRTLKQIKEDVNAMIPKWMHNHPLANLVGDLAIALRIKQAEMAYNAQESSLAKVKEDEREAVEPKSHDKPVGGRDSKGRFSDKAEFHVEPI